MMKNIYSILFFLFTFLSFSQIQHCGYDFTAYIVVNAHENGKENTKGLEITIVDENGVEIINENNRYRWNQGNEPMVFSENYLVSKVGEKERYFFPYATESYFLAVTNTFPAEDFSIKIEDTNGTYKTQIIPLESFNLYVLCATENEKQSRQFGPRKNRPIEVVLEKK